jgi:hypothetical protein
MVTLSVNCEERMTRVVDNQIVLYKLWAILE